jgi:hypothetical protein
MNVGRLRGGRQGATAPPAPPARASPLDPNLMLSPIERLARMLTGRFERQMMLQVSAKQKHEPMDRSCGKPPLQGVWGAARPPSGEREGRSPLAFAKQHIMRLEAVNINCRSLEPQAHPAGGASGRAHSHLRSKISCDWKRR